MEKWPFLRGDRSTASNAIASDKRPTGDRHRTSCRLIRAIAIQLLILNTYQHELARPRLHGEHRRTTG